MIARLGLLGLLGLALSACEVKQEDASSEETGDTEASAPEVSGPPPKPEIPERTPQGPALAEADSQNGDVRMAVTEASRSNGVLTIKARTTLVQGDTGFRRLLYDSDWEDVYYVTGDQKVMMLRDNEGDALSTEGGYAPTFDQLGDTNQWWGKFPAPPPEVRTISFYFKDFLPMENIPITDR